MTEVNDPTDRRAIYRTWRNLIVWPNGRVYDPDGRMLDATLKLGVYELLDELEKPVTLRDYNRITVAL
jgi:hypothetical protein